MTKDELKHLMARISAVYQTNFRVDETVHATWHELVNKIPIEFAYKAWQDYQNTQQQFAPTPSFFVENFRKKRREIVERASMDIMQAEKVWLVFLIHPKQVPINRLCTYSQEVSDRTMPIAKAAFLAWGGRERMNQVQAEVYDFDVERRIQRSQIHRNMHKVDQDKQEFIKCYNRELTQQSVQGEVLRLQGKSNLMLT